MIVKRYLILVNGGIEENFLVNNTRINITRENKEKYKKESNE